MNCICISQYLWQPGILANKLDCPNLSEKEWLTSQIMNQSLRDGVEMQKKCRQAQEEVVKGENSHLFKLNIHRNVKEFTLANNGSFNS